jgi:hypothetical protein
LLRGYFYGKKPKIHRTRGQAPCLDKHGITGLELSPVIPNLKAEVHEKLETLWDIESVIVKFIEE